MVTGIVFQTEVSDDVLRGIATDFLHRIASHPARRIRERQFTVFACRWISSIGEHLNGIALPSRQDHRVHFIAHAAVKARTGIRELGTTMARDLNAQPIFRYENGRIVRYVDPLSPILDYPSAAETRSAEFVGGVSALNRRREPLPRVRDAGPTRHALRDWATIQADLQEFVGRLISPGTFVGLRNAAKKQFGIQTTVGATAEAGRHGSIRVGWVGIDLAAPVHVTINKDLPPTMKYTVLAHELAHYVLHFPLLLASQIVEQLSWSHPSLRWRFEQELALLGDHGKLEEQANWFASYLLVPPWYNYNNIAKNTIMGRRPIEAAELAWAFLQPYFPETMSTIHSWRNLEQSLARANRDIQQAQGVNSVNAQTLYLAMLSATLERSDPAVPEAVAQMTQTIVDLWNALPRLVSEASALGEAHSGQHPPSNILDSGLSDRKRLPPLMRSSGEAPGLPLVPTRRGPGKRKWLNVIDPGAKARFLEEWRQDFPELAMILYPEEVLAADAVLTADTFEGAS
ncbi:ImmA/IrrE family metallo-endopeptidase [Micromonospora globbae]|uniref:ImmA/IrrE family metallo-endopeptidase n=1 Tax=Micromonospora globbae TaxID=1894969 RepID=UPI00386A592B|nr:ImmA/IrrE family metallo-endopeptidase [Micromonospora globbae]